MTATDAVDKLFTTQNPLGPIAVPDGESTSVLRALYDTRVDLHLQSKHNPPTFIVGRRGSGKTALLLSREFEPGNLVVRLGAQGAFSQMRSATKLIGSQTILTVEGVAALWELLLWAPIITRLVLAERRDVDPQRALQLLWEETGAVRRDIERSPSPDDAALDFVMTRLIEHIMRSENVLSLEHVKRDFRLAKRTWDDVIDAAKEVLAARRTPVFVLIDSLENIGDHLENLEDTLQGLFHLTGRLGLRAGSLPFRIQCCFPSELWPELDKVSANPMKDFSGHMVLRWNWTDLLKAVGTRLRTFLEQRYPQALRGIPDDDYETLLDRVVTPSLRNLAGAPERTIGYVLRHTQLLPRQVLYIFNEALHRAIIESTGRLVVRPAHIVESVCEAEATLCAEVFSAHRYRYPQAKKVAGRLIPYLPFRFDDGYLHKMCNRAAIKNDFGLDYREVREMFTDVGILGRYLSETDRYLRAEFAYAMQGQLMLSPDEKYCLHPLFVRQYNSKDARPSSRADKPVYPFGTPEQSWS
jgi:hypothetical protein